MISLLTLPLAGRYLERIWGQKEFIKFTLAVVLFSNVIAVIVNYIESYVLGDSALYLDGMSYHGLMGLQVGFLVAFTQLIPEHQVQIFGGLAKIRVKVSMQCSSTNSLADETTFLNLVFTNGLCYCFKHCLLTRISITVYPHSIWLAWKLYVPTIRQI